MGFKFYKHLLGADNPVTVHQLIGNSKTVAVGDMVNTSTGYVQRATAGSLVHGVCVGIVNKDGIDLKNASTDTYDGTYDDDAQSYVSTSDNVTDKLVKAIVVSDPFVIWEGAADEAVGVTDRFQFLDLVDHDTVDGDSNTESKGQVQLWDFDPNDTDRVFVRIGEWAGFPYAQQSE
jgi:hypothetical protein